MNKQRRRGFSYLELQVALVLLMIALSGLAPLTIVQSRQLSRVDERFAPDTTYYLTPADTNWGQKLGAPAGTSLYQPGPKPPAPPTAQLTLTVDDRDEGYKEKNKSWWDWWHYTNAPEAYGDDFTLNYPDNKNDQAIWTFENVPPGDYQLLATWRAWWFANKKADYNIYLNDVYFGARKNINQTKWPNNEYEDGVAWKKLRKVTVTSPGSKVEVRMSDKGAWGYNVMDAMRLKSLSGAAGGMYLHDVKDPLDGDVTHVVVHTEFSGFPGHGDGGCKHTSGDDDD